MGNCEKVVRSCEKEIALRVGSGAVGYVFALSLQGTRHEKANLS